MLTYVNYYKVTLMERIDPDGLDEVVIASRAAAARLDEVVGSAVATLASIGQHTGAAAVGSALERASETLVDVSVDLGVRAEGARRIERVFNEFAFYTALNLSAAMIPGTERPDGPPVAFDAGVVRVSQLFALVGVMGPETGELLALLAGDEPVPPRYSIDEWLVAAYPDLAQRRFRIGDQLEVLLARQAELRSEVSDGTTTPSTYDWLSDARIVDELADLDEQIGLLVTEWQVGQTDIKKFLDPMSVADRDALLGLVVIMVATIGRLPDEFGPYANVELERLKVDYAIAQYMATPGGGPQVRELGQTINALDPQNPGLVTAFLDGLFLGDITDTDYQGGGGLANLLGLVVSGELVFGDIRDVIVGLRRDNYGDAALAAFGFIPFVGAIRRIGDAASTARQIRRATAAFRRQDPAGTYVRAARVTRAGRKLATQVLKDIGNYGDRKSVV